MGHPSKYGRLRFCPECGLEKLKRDHYPFETFDDARGHKHPKEGCEYICEGCGTGFRIGKSRRVYAADALHKEHRKLRNGVKFSDKCISPEVVKAFNQTDRREPQKP